MATEKKRFLITYADGSIGTSQASQILGMTSRSVKDGVSFLETDSDLKGSDVLHFETLGISSFEMTQKEADTLSKNDKILAVEEDVTMYALEIDSESVKDGVVSDPDDILGDAFFDNAPVDTENGESDAYAEPSGDTGYLEGYNRALLDIIGTMMSSQSQTAASASAVHPSLPFPPQLRFPYRPIYPIRPPFIIPKQPTPWNMNLIKAPRAWARGLKGQGIKVAVLDTGIANHPDLQISGGASFVPGVSSYNDGHSHGTHCAGIIGARNNFIGVVGVAPSCRLYAVKVLSDAGSGSSSWIISGMEWCIRNGMKVASMSLGGKNAPSVAYANAVKRCQDRGVTVVIASGNSYGSSFPWVCAPANSYLPGVANESPIAVGAINSSSQIGYFSSRGGQHNNWNQVTCVAPGVSVKSTVLNNGYGNKTGTSMACPHVAGLAALVMQRFPGISPAGVRTRIAATASNLGPGGYDTTYGFGLIDCDRATR